MKPWYEDEYSGRPHTTFESQKSFRRRVFKARAAAYDEEKRATFRRAPVLNRTVYKIEAHEWEEEGEHVEAGEDVYVELPKRREEEHGDRVKVWRCRTCPRCDADTHHLEVIARREYA